MKKVLIIIFLVFIITMAALFVFILTFDANKYKGVLSEKIEGAIDKDVKIGNISLNIFPRLSFKVAGLVIKDNDMSWDNAMLRAGSIDATLKILPLFKKDIEIENLKLRGIELVIDKDTLITMPQPKGAQKVGINTGVAAAGVMKFLAEFISIADSSVKYIDRNPQLPMDVKIGIIEANIKNVSLYGPVNIEANLSVFSRGAENIDITATLYPEIDTKKPYIKNLELTINLAKLNIIEGLTALGRPDLAHQLIGKEISGRLNVSSERLNLNTKEIYGSDIFISLSDGETNALPIKEAVRSIDLKGELKKGDMILEKFKGSLAGGSFSAKGLIKDVFSRQESDIDITLQNVTVAKLLPETALEGPGFEGVLGMSVQLQTTGLTEKDIIDSLAVKGHVDIEDLVLKDVNILVLALDKLDMLPRLVSKLKDNLPDRYKELLKQKDTAFKPIALDFNILNSRCVFQKTLIESDAFYLSGSGYLALNRDILVRSDIFIPKDLSEAFIAVVRELGYLQNPQGMITMPVEISGKFPDIYVKPDLNYVIQRLAVAKGQELLESIFKKEGPVETQEQSQAESEIQPNSTSAEPAPKQEKVKPEEAIIRTIFDIITTPKN